MSSTYAESDVEALAEVIHNARMAGIHHGNYTLARWILDRWPVASEKVEALRREASPPEVQP